MIKKTVYEFNPDDVDNALRTHFEGGLHKMKMVESGDQSFFGILLANKDVQDACQAVVSKQVQIVPGTVWKFCMTRDANGRVSVSVSLT